ncbi:MAG: LLM class flavin-dependent oxidoreductase [Pseudomonadota bacterium]
MHPGLDQKDSWRHMQEMLPAVRALWQGDYAHDGAYWQFPASTSCPKPKQGEVPVWVAARSPITFDYAVQNGCSIMTWPITMPFAEAETYKERLDTAITAHGQPYRGTFAMMRHTSVYTSEADREALMAALIHSLARFGNLMMKAGEVTNGFVEEVPLEKLSGNSRYDPATLHDNLSFGSPDEVTEKIKRYEALGVDASIYNGSMGLDPAQQRRAFGLFIDEVLPAFA